MKKIIALTLAGLSVVSAGASQSTEMEFKTTISEATVFINGAQLVRKKQIDVPRGQILLKFTGLSPYVESQSVQVKATGALTILSVNFQRNYLDKLQKPENAKDLESRLEELEDRINLENMYLETLNEELSFLQENRKVENENENAALLREIAEFYAGRVREIKLEQLERNKALDSLIDEQERIERQFRESENNQPESTGEVWVKVEAPAALRSDFEIVYLVNNAGWNPSYDTRVESIEQPVRLTYKANVYQKTKVDWKNVKLKISSGNPTESATAPQLQTYFLNYHSAPPSYGSTVTRVTGRIFDSEANEPLPGVNVTVKGTTIGVISDIEGFYDISIPPNAALLTFSAVGYKTEEVSIANRPVINVSLSPDVAALQEIVVVGYGTESKKESEAALRGKLPGVSALEEDASVPIQLQRVENQTSVEFDIQTPYDIPSDGQNYAISMETFDMPADYLYTSIPKIAPEAFLIARVADWEQFNLLEGEVNLFFEGTYVGKSILDVRNTSDTLTLSLGKDKNVVVKREKRKNYTTRQFIGSKKEETLTWLINVKNNKSQTIHINIYDQVPVSTLEEIEVNVNNRSGGELNEETGEIKWELEVSPARSEEMELSYAVKYPKNRRLVIE